MQIGSLFVGDLQGPVTFPVSGNADLWTGLRVDEIHRNSDELHRQQEKVLQTGAFFINDIITSS